MAGGEAVANRAIKIVHKGQRTDLSSIVPIESIQSKDVIAAAAAAAVT